MKHTFQVGDRVYMLDYDREKGTVFTVNVREDGSDTVGVSPDDQEKFQKQFEPREKILQQHGGKLRGLSIQKKEIVEVSLYVASENLELIGSQSLDPEWKDIWDSN